jgi:hypothetical protein
MICLIFYDSVDLDVHEALKSSEYGAVFKNQKIIKIIKIMVQTNIIQI